MRKLRRERERERCVKEISANATIAEIKMKINQ